MILQNRNAEKLTSSRYWGILGRIQIAIEAAQTVFSRFTPGEIEAEYKAGHDPVTEADRAVDTVLRESLLREHEGWLSEETVDNPSRLEKRRLWIVDPLDGTREFILGLPEFCVSIAFVEDGKAVAGGIYNPATRENFLGAIDAGIFYNGKSAAASAKTTLAGALILASRSEVKRGEWQQFQSANLQIRPIGSVAYKLALVAAGMADATFTLTPKHEWDIAAGAALVESAGGYVATLDNSPLRCNNRNPLLNGLVACGAGLREELIQLIRHYGPVSPAKER
jgi:myo-inositol-1(or 4)-monophosphatase